MCKQLVHNQGHIYNRDKGTITPVPGLRVSCVEKYNNEKLLSAIKIKQLYNFTTTTDFIFMQ